MLKCNKCNYYFRHPKDKANFNEKFYQEDYFEHGITRNIPPPWLLEQYKKNNFKNSEKDYFDKIEVIKQLPIVEISNIIDFGASWGYASYQFNNAGFNVQSYEISKKMAIYGRELLGIDIKYDLGELKKDNNIFFSAHVLEHIPTISDVIDLAKKLLVENGYFIAFTPNGSIDYRMKSVKNWSHIWGLVHPVMINIDFYKTIFKDNPYLITSSPYELGPIKNWDGKSQKILRKDGPELLIICKINKKIND